MLKKLLSGGVLATLALGLFPSAASSQVLECNASVTDPVASPTQILGLSGHRVSATGYGKCDYTEQLLLLTVEVHSVGAGMSGMNPYTRTNSDQISGGVSAGFAAGTVCYAAVAQVSTPTGDPDAAFAGCNTTDEDD